MAINPYDIQIQYIEKLISLIKEQYNIDFSGYSINFLRRRIASRMNRLQILSAEMYRRFISENQDELSNLLQNLTINTSEFMRNPEVFKYIQNRVFTELSEKLPNRQIHIWDAGCSRGEEAYSLAIAYIKSGIKNEILITATDIDEIALQQAKKGVYNDSSLKNLAPIDRHTFFEKTDNIYIVRDRLRSLIVFKKHDLINGPDLGKFDFIVCRNVSIYFDKELQERMYLRFYNSLSENGFLVIGISELMPSKFSDMFTIVSPENRVYRRLPSG